MDKPVQLDWRQCCSTWVQDSNLSPGIEPWCSGLVSWLDLDLNDDDSDLDLDSSIDCIRIRGRAGWYICIWGDSGTVGREVV